MSEPITNDSGGDTFEWPVNIEMIGQDVPLESMAQARDLLKTLTHVIRDAEQGSHSPSVYFWDAQLYRVGRDRLVIMGDPCRDLDEDGDNRHNCDDMGCGSTGPHVIARGLILQRDNDDPEWNRSRAMLDILARVHGVKLAGAEEPKTTHRHGSMIAAAKDGPVVQIDRDSIIAAIEHVRHDVIENAVDESYNLALASLAHVLGLERPGLGIASLEWPELDGQSVGTGKRTADNRKLEEQLTEELDAAYTQIAKLEEWICRLQPLLADMPELTR